MGAVKYDQQFKSCEWYTPPWLCVAAEKLLGGIDLDPFSCELANSIVQAGKFYALPQDGLALPWAGRVFVNPPGGAARLTQKAWKKLYASHAAGEVTAGVFLSFTLNALQTTQGHSPGGVLAFPTWVSAKRVSYWSDDLEAEEKPVSACALTWLPPRGTPPGEAAERLAAVMSHAPMAGVTLKGTA